MEIEGKEVKVIFSDGENHYSKKTGIVKSVDNIFLTIVSDGKQEIIPISRIIRMEVDE